MTTARLRRCSRQITDLVNEARALAEVPVAQRETDDHRARLIAFRARKARLLGGPPEPDRGQ